MFGRDRLADWMLDPSITYLNHGTVGAPPRAVLKAQQEMRDAIERSPAQAQLRETFLPFDGKPSRLRQAASTVADFLGANGEDLVFVDNATAGVNAVLQWFPFQPGDVLVTTSMAYGSFPPIVELMAKRLGLVVHRIELPHPVTDAAALVQAFEAQLPESAALVLVDHIVSSNALLLPIEELIASCKRRGMPVLVDGAHAPGSIDLNIEALGADIYVGNLHKWMWTPRSSAILWSAKRWQEHLRPTSLSWGLNEGFTAEFDCMATRDYTAHLCAPASIAELERHGAAAVREHNHNLALQAGELLREAWGTAPLAPPDMVASMVSVELPPSLSLPAGGIHELRATLFDEHKIEVHLGADGKRCWARVAAQIYNDLSDVQRLADVVAGL